MVVLDQKVYYNKTADKTIMLLNVTGSQYKKKEQTEYIQYVKLIIKGVIVILINEVNRTNDSITWNILYVDRSGLLKN